MEFNDDRTEISKELEVYRRVTGTFGFQMEKKNKHTVMPGKLHFVSILKFQFLFFLCFKFQYLAYVSLICCKYLVAKLWLKSNSFTKDFYLGA